MRLVVSLRYVSIALLIVAIQVARVTDSADSPMSDAYARNPVVGCPSEDATSTISILTATVDIVKLL
jgi:hypothetical protein